MRERRAADLMHSSQEEGRKEDRDPQTLMCVRITCGKCRLKWGFWISQYWIRAEI